MRRELVATAAAPVPTPAVTAAPAAVAAAPAAVAAAPASPAAAATTAFGAGSSLVDRQRPTAIVLAVERVDRGLGPGVVGHLDEAEAAAPVRHAVHDHLGRLDRAILLEELDQIIRRRVVGQVAHV